MGAPEVLKNQPPRNAVAGATSTSEKLPMRVFTISAATRGLLMISHGVEFYTMNIIRSVM